MVVRVRPFLLLLALLAACGSGQTPTLQARADGPPTCDEVTTFAEALADVGVTYDHQPSASPATLASRVDVVFRGHLTGGFEHRDARPDEPVTSWIGFEVAVAESLQGEAAVGERVLVAVGYNPQHRAAGAYEALVPAGAEVVVFAEELRDPPAELFIGVEGFATACEGARPLGRLGATAAWTEPATLERLLEVADSPSDRVEVVLWHCGIGSITVDDRRWEVPNEEEPFDGTNAPASFAGSGTIERVGPDELRYLDDSGVVLRFVPDDGVEPPCA